MIIEKGTSLGDTRSDRLITDDVAVCLRHNQHFAPDLRQAMPFARNVDNA